MDIKASEVVGEMKKLRRLFEVLERGEEMIRVLSEQEQRKAAIEKEVAALLAEKAALDKDITAKVEKANKDLNAAAAKVEAAQASVEASDARAQEIVSKAKKQAAEILATAAGECKQLKILEEGYKKQADAARQAAEAATAAKDRLEFEFEARKKELFKAFN